MSFSKHFSAVLSESHNRSSPVSLPSNILEAFIPGYSIISQFLFELLGFDFSIVVSAGLILFVLGTTISYLYGHASELFKVWCMSFVSIDSDDDLFDHIMDWVAEQKVSKDALSLVARTGHSSWDADDVDGMDEDEAIDSGMLLNFSNWDSKILPKFQPYYGKHRFWHAGRYFELRRETKTTLASGGWGSLMKDEETLRLSCIGRSTQPIKDLIKVCQDRFFDKKSSRTTVRRPATKERRSWGRSPWTTVAKRPSRPIDTVVLDHNQKELILADINEYLHPSTPRWYANRGIPYRRGYLFSGFAGCGKSSLSLAIAGYFGLDIYCISLLEPTLTEEDLVMLFNSLPRRCVVLLEDIDSAGIVKREESDGTKPDGDKKDKDKNPGISLSGLLNAIDGVASQEGRILIMTTNFPEKLDEALIRPGRVDMKIGFTLASQNQILQLFTRMYSTDVEEAATTAMKPSIITTSNGTVEISRQAKPEEKRLLGDGDATAEGSDGVLTPPPTPKSRSAADVELYELARQFSDQLPEGTFSPAEIQGFLLRLKRTPAEAVRTVAKWRDDQLALKSAKKKL